MANEFTQALQNTYSHEGDKAFKEPTGDISVKGIRQNVYDSWTKQKGLPSKKVSELTPKERATFVQEVFVKQPGLNRLPSALFEVVFDFSFNSGPQTAIAQLQKVIGAEPDGIIGPETVAKANQALEQHGVDAVINSYLDARQDYIQSIKSLNKYQKGLQKRIDSYRR